MPESSGSRPSSDFLKSSGLEGFERFSLAAPSANSFCASLTFWMYSFLSEVLVPSSPPQAASPTPRARTARSGSRSRRILGTSSVIGRNCSFCASRGAKDRGSPNLTHRPAALPPDGDPRAAGLWGRRPALGLLHAGREDAHRHAGEPGEGPRRSLPERELLAVVG